MNIHPWVWFVTVGVLLVVLAIDLFVIGRRPHEPSLREASLWVSFYVALAVLFGIGVLVVSGPRYGAEFFAGWITEYSLSIDNLFVFVIIMSRFAVPREYQQTVLLWGIVLALVMRGIFIALGAAVIAQFSLDLLRLRGVPDLHRDRAGAPRRLRGVQREHRPAMGSSGAALDDGVPRRGTAREGGRQARCHADAHCHDRDRHYRPAVRAGFDPRDLRSDAGAVPRLHRERLRAHGACGSCTSSSVGY